MNILNVNNIFDYRFRAVFLYFFEIGYDILFYGKYKNKYLQSRSNQLILSGLEIKKEIGKSIFIDPYDEAMINPNSYNLKLYDKLMVYDESVLDMKKQNMAHEVIIPQEGILLKPGELYLGRTTERTFTNKFVPMLEGRSSVGRLGLFIHVTAGFGDVGFDGYWTLEIQCVKPIIIYPNIEICQIYFHTIHGEFEEYKSNKYQHNNGIQTSMLYKDFK